ncbi:SusD/RagB family nutrient-binding outer membrane lipoprotein [Telluribacter sp.]|jgi:hypothetical protein|uniref:SusD/RagB family nutrient-binding outer membrane lipoprotein n=1 Tax=Telluribacter sp. TaxID=1978767 RepID=UPI002E114059|nr:SusD/RagB family nutrient-binding outer membrane lipoprotein [Telluribacter sp.]
MKKIICLLIAGLVFGCTNHFDELNTDKKNPASVTGESLFNNATERFHHILNSASVNTNVFRLYAQYWAQTTYPEESQYQQVQRNIPDNWFQRLYRDALKDLDEAKRLIAAQETNSQTAPIQKNKLAIIEITEAHIYTTLVDLFGNVPYSEALDFANPNPKYDDAKDIYYSEIDQLNQAIANLEVSASSFESTSDLVNQGDTKMWLKSANSLKLRLAMRLADVDEAKSRTMAESAVSSGVFSAISENLSVEYINNAPYTYPAYEDLVLSGRSDFVAANTIVEVMNDLKDPRRKYYFQENLGQGTFAGGIYGSGNAFTSFSSPGMRMYTANTPGVNLSYSEVLFLLAEAAQRGYSVGGTVEEYYNRAITASVMEWGGTEAEARAYLSQKDVAWSTAAGDWRQKLGLQKWLSLYNNGMEGWTTWRLLDFEGFKVPEGLTEEDIPNRLVYPVNEATLNGANLSAAATAIGGDNVQSKIFWDVR